MREQLVLQLVVIGELPVEGEGKPLRLAAVVALERLGIGAVVAAAGGIAHVADRDRPVHPAHDRLELVAMIEPKRLGDRADLLVGVDQRIAVGTIAGHAGGELAAVLHVEQHPRDQPRHTVDVAGNRSQCRNRTTRGMVNSGHAALMVQFTHVFGSAPVIRV